MFSDLYSLLFTQDLYLKHTCFLFLCFDFDGAATFLLINSYAWYGYGRVVAERCSCQLSALKALGVGFSELKLVDQSLSRAAARVDTSAPRPFLHRRVRPWSGPPSPSVHW